jgi:predicted AAA+ superfamily ATPase
MIKDIMDVLIKDSLIHRTKTKNNLYLNSTQYAREYKIVGIITPRQYGKSSYINEFCYNTLDRVAIVVPNHRMKVEREKLFTHNGNVEVHTFGSVVMDDPNKQRGLRYFLKPTWVFLDEVEADEASLYKLLEHFNDTGNSLQTFIWMKT